MYVYTCIHIHAQIYVYTLYSQMHLFTQSNMWICNFKQICKATTLPPKPRAYLMSVKASMIKQNNRWYSRNIITNRCASRILFYNIMDSNKIMWNIDNLSKIYINHQCHHCTHRRVCHSAACSAGGVITGKTQHCVPGPGTIVPRVRGSRVPGCSFEVPRQPVNATEPRRRCQGRVTRVTMWWLIIQKKFSSP